MEQPLFSCDHYSEVTRVHTWQPTISHPNAHYDQAGSDLQHDAVMVVWATQEEPNSEWHTGGKVHLEGVQNTNEGVTGSPSAAQLDNFSCAPTVHNNSWDWEKQPSGPNLERSRLQSIE